MTAVCSLAVFFTCVLLTLQIPRMWTQGKGHTHSQDCRTIESGQISRDDLSDGCPEIVGYLILAMLPDLVFFSVQCGFVPHRQAAEGVYRIKRILGSVQGMGLQRACGPDRFVKKPLTECYTVRFSKHCVCSPPLFNALQWWQQC